MMFALILLIGRCGDGGVLAVGGVGSRSGVSCEADQADCPFGAGWMSRLSAKGLVLGRRRDSDARIMALDTTMVSSCDAAVGLALGDAGCCSELSFEADTVDCAVGAGRRHRFHRAGVGA